MKHTVKKILYNSIVSKCLETSDCEKFFRGKNVVIIGPNSALSEDLIEKVKSADILAVINKGHRSQTFKSLKAYARKVVLFHCLDLSEETGGGMFSAFELRKKGIHEVYYPLHEERYFQNIAAYHMSNFWLLPLRRIEKKAYSRLKDSIKRFTPNTGYAAIWIIAKSSCSNLYISGINFMRIPYNSSYHPHINQHSDLIKLIEKYGNHNPDLDFESFRELYKNGNIQVDNTLASALAMPTEFLFYRNGCV